MWLRTLVYPCPLQVAPLAYEAALPAYTLLGCKYVLMTNGLAYSSNQWQGIKESGCGCSERLEVMWISYKAKVKDKKLRRTQWQKL
jgi:hypothetical protein